MTLTLIPDLAHRRAVRFRGAFMNKIRLLTLALALSMPSAALAKDKPPELSADQLTLAQTQTFAAPFSAVMSSAVAALQTDGYMEIVASKDAGTVSGHTDAKSKLMYNFFWGLGKKKLTQTAQFLIEEIRPGQTTLRLNLFLNESKTRSIVFGSRMTDATLIKQGEPYRGLMDLVGSEVARRGGTRAASAN